VGWQLSVNIVPTIEHNGLIEMFRENPALAAHFLALLFRFDVPQHASARVADATLDQLVPIEFRADLVLELLDKAGSVVFAIVLEAQRDKNPRKKYSWPVYAAVARAERECPTVVLVLAIDAEVSAWAAEKIDLGAGRGVLEPFVLGPTTVPVVTDSALAETEVELAILSALAHGNGPQGLAVVQTALVALARLDREHAAVYFQIIWDILREPMQRALEALVMDRQTEGKNTFPPFAQQIFERGVREGKLDGIREGKLDGIREGKLDGIREGKLDGIRDALLRLLARAGIAIDEDDRARILNCTDAATLDRWVDNVLGAKTARDVLS
jgi:hypothetical protein